MTIKDRKTNKILDEITATIKNYIMYTISVSKKGDPELKEKILFLLTIHNSEIITKAQEIYNKRSSFDKKRIETVLDNYVEELLKEYEEFDLDNLDEELNLKKLGISNIAHNFWEVACFAAKKDLSEDYPQMAEYQKEILENYKELAEELGIKSGIDLSHYFTYLLWNGYFSPTKVHSYQITDRIIDYPTLEVFEGKGVCLNYAYLQKEFLRICGKEAEVASCYFSPKNILQIKNKQLTQAEEKAKNLRASIERNADISIKGFVSWIFLLPIIFSLSKSFGNHVITLVRDEKREFYYDATNLYVLKSTQNTKATIINGVGEYILKRHLSMYLKSNPSKELLGTNIQNILLKGNNSFIGYTLEETNETMERIFGEINNNRGLIDEAYEKIRPTILRQEQAISENKPALQKKKIK